jgi:uncharacterized repeat protein (TIGR03803 family)
VSSFLEFYSTRKTNPKGKMKTLASRLRLFFIAILLNYSALYAQQQLVGVTMGGGGSGLGTFFKTDSNGENFVTLNELYSPTPGVQGVPAVDLTQHPNGKLYGCAITGGAFNQGVIFEFDPVANSYRKVYDFDGPQGAHPTGILTLVNGKYYGVTQLGGATNGGVIFEFDPITGSYIKKVDFVKSDIAKWAEGGLTLAADGLLYGAFSGYSVTNPGKIYAYTPGSATIAIRHVAASVPTQLLLATNGKIYGCTMDGGVGGESGAIFEYDYVNDILTQKYDFANTAAGYVPLGKMVQHSNGKLYGLCTYGGANGQGVLYEFDISSGQYTNRFSFNKANGTGGYSQTGLVEQLNGKLLGAASDVIFEFDPTSNQFTSKYQVLTDDGSVASTMTRGADGFYYGITGKTYKKDGGLFKYDPAANGFQHLAQFNISTGAYPISDLVRHPNGKLYGIADRGGANNGGVLFEYNLQTNEFVDKHDFQTGFPYKNLITLTSKGTFYGSMYISEPEYPNGALYEFDPQTNAYTVFYTFNTISFSGAPIGKISEGPDGNYYGLTTHGDIFAIDPSTNNVTQKAHVPTGPSIWGTGALTLVGNKFYAVSNSGGDNGNGVIFEYDPVSDVATLKAQLLPMNVSQSKAGLTLDDQGKLWGTTTKGGASDGGIIFQYDPVSNTIVKKFEFSPSGGTLPIGTLTLSTNGKLYGLTANGGQYGEGVMFEFDPATNAYVVKTNFSGLNGSPFNVDSNHGALLALETHFQAITFDALLPKKLGDSPFTLDATASSGLPVSFTSDNPNVATINGNVVTVTGAGEVNIIASQQGNGIYDAAPQVTQKLTVTLGKPTSSATLPVFANVYSTQMDLSFTAGNGQQRLLVVRPDAAVNFVPTDNVVYTAGPQPNGNVIVKVGNFSSATITNLDPLRTYFVKVFEYNQSNAFDSYLTATTLSSSRATAAPPNVYLSSPANGAINLNVTVSVTAVAVTGATTYTIELNTAPDFTGTKLETIGSRTASISGLSYNTTYYSRVKTNVRPDYGPTKSFTTAGPEFFSYVTTPAHLATNVSANPTVKSNTVINATSYTIELNTSSTFPSASAIVMTASTPSIVFTNLQYSKTYYSRVKTNLSALWGATKSFTTKSAISETFITSPANNAVNQSTKLTFKVNKVNGATTYQIQVSPVSDFSSGVVSASGTDNLNLPISGLAYKTVYYARTSTNVTPGVWSANITLTTIDHAVTTPADGAVAVSYSPSITVNAVTGATQYTVQLSTAIDFSVSPITKSSTTTSIAFTGLAYDTKYYARVTSNIATGYGTVKSFTTGNPSTFAYVKTPVDGATNVAVTVTVASNAVPQATNYTIELNTSNLFPAGGIVKSSASASIAFSGLLPGTKYYSRVKTNLTGTWGAIKSFTTIASGRIAVTSASSPFSSSTVEQSFEVAVVGNPFHDHLKFIVKSPKDEAVDVAVSDMQGKLLHNSIEKTNSVIEVDRHFTGGVYLLKVITSENQKLVRVVKE